MRLWMDDQNRMLTDEQLLRQIAHHGSLRNSLEQGDVRLVTNGNDREEHDQRREGVEHRSLADYLQEG